MEFNGEIVEYSLKPQAARGPSEVAQMRFTISILVDFENRSKSENNFSQLEVLQISRLQFRFEFFRY